MIALRAKKKGKNLSEEETALLLKINQKIDSGIQKRYDVLIAKRRKETLTTEEETALLKLTDKIEKMESKRVEHLSQLAQLRGTSLSTLMGELDIQPPCMSEKITIQQKRTIAKRAKNCCEYCQSQARFAMQSFSVEHIIPKSKEGASTLENLAFCMER